MTYSFAAVDEVGQTGFKFTHGSSRLFAITLVLTNEPQCIRDGLERARRQIGLTGGTEFKFHSTPHGIRLKLLEQAATWPLVVRVLAVDKTRLPLEFRRLKSWEFYAFFVAELLNHLPVGELGRTTLVLDEFGPLQLTLRLIREHLRQRQLWGEKTHLLKRLTFRRSHSESLIQAADLCGGAIYRWLADGDETYYRLIRDNALVWAYHAGKTNPLT
jgi:hypothetical protein